MTEMVERMARAIAELPDLDLVGHGDRERYRAAARRALAELREPTEAMAAAGKRAMDDCQDAGGPDGRLPAACVPEHVWTAMADEALR